MTQLVLSSKQSNIYSWGWRAEARHRVAVCGRRFGKSYLGVPEVIRACRLAQEWGIPKDMEIWIGAPTFKQVKRVWWGRLKEYFPKRMLARKNETECTLTTRGGHTVRLVGLDKSAVDNLRGSGLFFFLGDEWADCHLQSWDEVIRPMLSTVEGHSLFIGTPKGKANHLYKHYRMGLDGEEDWKTWHYTTKDGGYVNDKEIAVARRDLDPRTFDQEYLAQFVSYSGLVFYAFDRDVNVRPVPYNPAADLMIGMDFNYNPMSAVVCQSPAPGIIHQVDEIVIPTSNTDEMVNEIKARYGEHSGRITVYPDPACRQNKTSAGGKTDLSILKDGGFRIEVMSSHPAIRDRVNVMNSRYKNTEGDVRSFIDPKCKQTIKCVEQLQYKEGTSIVEKDANLDHLPDAKGYLLYTLYGLKPAQRANLSIIGR